MNIFRFFLGIVFAMLLAPAQAQGLVPVPPLAARVTDTIGLINEQQRAALENTLAEYETRTGSQIAVLLIGSTSPEAIEQYSIRVFDAWTLGRKGIDDGVLLIVAKDNSDALRRFRIETGRGTQGSLTDAQSNRILQDVIAPYFIKNDFYGGLVAGVSAITVLLDKEQFAAPDRQGTADQDSEGGLAIFLFFIFMMFILFSRRRKHGRRGLGSAWGHGAGVILGSAIGSKIGHSSSGGFGGGGFGGGGFGGGGGFSGGGGSADGGGASGNW